MVTSVFLTLNGKWAITGSTDRFARLWYLSFLDEFENECLPSAACSAAVPKKSFDDLPRDVLRMIRDYIVYSEAGKDAHIFQEDPRPTVIYTHACQGKPLSIALSADGNWALVRLESNGSFLLDLRKKIAPLSKKLKNHARLVSSAACLSEDGRLALTTCAEAVGLHCNLDKEPHFFRI